MAGSEKKTELTRAEQKKATRRKLIETTIAIIATDGLSGVTLAKVAELAGLSRGICNYHFRTKDQLLLETFQTVYREHERAWKNALADQRMPPIHRLKRFIRVLLLPPVADFNKVAVWLAFWGEATNRRNYLYLCTAMDQDFENEVAAVLGEIGPPRNGSSGMDLGAVAVALTGMIDGFWVQYLIAPGRLSPEHAISACLAYLSRFYPEFCDTDSA
ncbi:MAG: TetR family transcriptional regulator C-terminal domain-containing protein [Desulfohalobiaceae bacterium]|nr:TetR family transcriptional regulator C-terminal domain-containing protein [Desulfohalobiaceae bacterium]